MQIEYKKRFQKSFKKLSYKTKEQFYARLAVFAIDRFDPMLNNHPVDRVFPGCRSINITGDYRAIFREQSEVVTFVMIGTHSQLYG